MIMTGQSVYGCLYAFILWSRDLISFLLPISGDDITVLPMLMYDMVIFFVLLVVHKPKVK